MWRGSSRASSKETRTTSSSNFIATTRRSVTVAMTTASVCNEQESRESVCMTIVYMNLPLVFHMQMLHHNTKTMHYWYRYVSQVPNPLVFMCFVTVCRLLLFRHGGAGKKKGQSVSLPHFLYTFNIGVSNGINLHFVIDKAEDEGRVPSPSDVWTYQVLSHCPYRFRPNTVTSYCDLTIWIIWTKESNTLFTGAVCADTTERVLYIQAPAERDSLW